MSTSNPPKADSRKDDKPLTPDTTNTPDNQPTLRTMKTPDNAIGN